MTKNNRFDGHAASRSATMRAPVPFTLLAAVLLLSASAAAHGPPAKRDQDFRLLADHNDDCGGDDAAGLSRCNDTHDLVGLDLREAHDATHGDLVYVRLIVNGGEGALKDVVTLKAGGAVKTFELRTGDNAAFQGTGFATTPTVSPATNADGSKDGARIVVEAGIRLADLGGAGAKLTEFRVQAYSGQTRGDYMPGGYYGFGDIQDADPEQGTATNFERTAGYVLQGPTYYVTASAPDATIPAGGSVDVEVEVTNSLRSTPQTAAVSVEAGDGVTASTSTPTLDLAKAGTATAKVRLDAAATATAGVLTVTITTNLGGRTVLEVPFDVAPSATYETTEPHGPSNDAPGPVAVLTALALLAFAAHRRR